MTPENFKQGMQPASGLEGYATTVKIQELELQLHAYDSGAGKDRALLLIHGLGDESDTWRHVFLPLARQYRVIAPDLPGFGRSDKPRLAYNLDFYCQSLVALLDTLGIQQFTLAGSSMGGMIAHKIALDFPSRVEGLVLVGGSMLVSAGSADAGILLFALPGLGEYLYTRLRRDPQAAYETLQGYYADLDGLPDEDRAFLYQRVNERVWSDGQRRAYLSSLRQMILASFTGGIKRYEASLAQSPVIPHLIWGEQDRIMPVENARALQALILGVKLDLVPGSGHLPHQEKPEDFLRFFLNALPEA